MPKNFQILQYDEPLCIDGYLDVDVDGETVPGRDRAGAHGGGHRQEHPRRRRHRPHPRRRLLAGRLQPRRHPAGRDRHQAGAGTGALAPEVARAYVTELRDILRTLGVSDVRMEQGSLRCDVNTSLAPAGRGEWGTRTETKNVNSLRSVERAVRSEMMPAGRRCSTRGGRIMQETRHFHEDDRRHPRRAQQGGGDRLPLLPRARPGADRAGRRVGRASCAPALPELPAARRERLSRRSASAPTTCSR